MRLPRIKTWWLMAVVAVVAVLFAWLGVRGAIALTAMPLLAFSPIVFIPPGRRLAVSAWIAALYPVLIPLSLYATWVTAWCVLGYRPRPSLDDPKNLGPLVMGPFLLTSLSFSGSLVSLLACVVLTAMRIERQFAGKRHKIFDFLHFYYMMILWISPYLVLWLDPFGVLNWFLD